jgi:SNF2 family DNA or RNA helicase
MEIKLKPHQKKVVNYMKLTKSRGIILYHGLGSGKTITSIAISKLYNKTVIIISPASMRSQWKDELNKMDIKKSNYIIYSFESFLNFVELNNVDTLKNKVIIVDEAHRIRSSKGKTSIILVALLQTAFKVILLTGTPMVNSPEDISPLVNSILGDNILPTDEKKFREKFFILKSKNQPPENKRCKNYSSITCTNNGFIYKNGLCNYHYVNSLKTGKMKKLLNKKDINGLETLNEWKIVQKNRIQLARARVKLGILKPNISEFSKFIKKTISYYKPKQDINYFPEVKEKIIKVKMNNEQYNIYLKYQKKVNKEDLNFLESGIEVTSKSSSMNAFLNKTRQISNTWNGKKNTPKLNKILNTLKKNPKPALIYSNWIENGINPLSEMLDDSNIKYLKFIGGMSDKKKDEVIKKYNNKEIDALLLSSSGGEGLDLKNTRQIHIMEPHWNEAKISQVKGRGIRYKSHSNLPLSERKVTVFNWISVPINNTEIGTDEYLYQISNKKVEEIGHFLESIIKNSIENFREKKLINQKIKNIKNKIGGSSHKIFYLDSISNL